MDYSLVVNALQLSVYLGGFVVVAALAGAVIAGVLRVATQIDDPSIGFAARLAAVIGAIYLGADFGLARISEFASQVWGSSLYFY
jgi:flagellar biosynthesis protein FliQ